jgi:sugar phosphate isomerase/epimerase
MKSTRRDLLKTMVVAPLITPLTGIQDSRSSPIHPAAKKTNALKTSLNAFSFNGPLTKGTMSLEEMFAFCAEQGFAAVDITAYYFPGYPNVPSDDFLYATKMKAFRQGLDISGTGVRNDFTEPDGRKRAESVALVKAWIEAAEKLGAPVIRIFSGNQSLEGYTREQISEWMLKDIKECMEFGKKHGVVVAIQNHNDFIKTANHAIRILEAVNSEWFGLILDTGSYRTGDPYEEIGKTAPYAVNWQIKEKVFIRNEEVETDMEKLISIIVASGYKGYLPLETLGEGDPKIKVSQLLNKLNKALENG